jgi:hypothetical protein
MEQPEMEQRVTRLEAHFEYIRHDLDEIKAEQRSFSSKLDAMNALLNDIRVELAKRPTTGQFWGMIGFVGAIALATVAIRRGSEARPATPGSRRT